MLKLKRFSFLKDLKENPRETLRKTGKGAVDYAVDNPIDTAAWAVGDLYVPAKLAGMAKKKWTGKKGKIAAGALGVYALSPFGLTTLAIHQKNKWKERRNASKDKNILQKKKEK